MTGFMDLAFGILVFGFGVVLWKYFNPELVYCQLKGKYKLYRFVKELEKRKIFLGEIDNYLRVNLYERKPKAFI